MTRKDLKERLKLAFGLHPNREDGNITDDNFNLAINMAIRLVAYDCNLLPELRKFSVEVNKWRYPLDNDVDNIRSVWYITSNGQRIPLEYCSPENFYDYYNPSSVATVPEFYCYPMMQGEVYEFWAGAPDVYDYVICSNVTASTVRTIVDSGIRFGVTRQGKLVKPGDVVHNITDDSYGYVEVLDITTSKVTGTATTLTNTNTLYDTNVDFISSGVKIGDIICTPSSGVVKGYAVVTSVSNNYLAYTNYYSVDGTVAFSSGNTYKVGNATEIRLRGTPPHPGLRTGHKNYFHVSSTKATVTGSTVFTSTSVTGNLSSGAEVGDVAIASNGSHGLITSIGDNYVGVNYWIGGIPHDGATVEIKECDTYQVETHERIQRAIWLGPTPSASDTVGTESLEILYTSVPRMPTTDYEILEIPDKYEQPLQRCGEWQVAILTGTFSRMELDGFERAYRMSVMPFKYDIYRNPSGTQLSVWGNRKNLSRYTKRWNVKTGD